MQNTRRGAGEGRMIERGSSKGRDDVGAQNRLCPFIETALLKPACQRFTPRSRRPATGWCWHAIARRLDSMHSPEHSPDLPPGDADKRCIVDTIKRQVAGIGFDHIGERNVRATQIIRNQTRRRQVACCQ
jgi:hypothetical protein